MKKHQIFIGTSGWHYAYWKKHFYPEKIASKDFLSFFKEKFNVVEINNSFYKIPAKETFEKWKNITGDNFIFALKANRYFTHMKKLKESGPRLKKFIKNADNLGEKLGPLLFQLPPGWHCNIERLSSFIKALDKKHKYTFEFRDKSWLNKDVYNLLRENNIALCSSCLSNENTITADFIYLRLHGPGKIYESSYSKKELSVFAGIIKRWNNSGKTVYCFFDNDKDAYAAKNAFTLKKILYG